MKWISCEFNILLNFIIYYRATTYKNQTLTLEKPQTRFGRRFLTTQRTNRFEQKNIKSLFVSSCIKYVISLMNSLFHFGLCHFMRGRTSKLSIEQLKVNFYLRIHWTLISILKHLNLAFISYHKTLTIELKFNLSLGVTELPNVLLIIFVWFLSNRTV